jgi:molybdopterin-guanine dinucleotide biosynthesis protein A
MSGHVTALVLAGGQSQRMGQDKALLHLQDGETLVEHALAVAAAVAPEVKLVGPRARYAQFSWAGEVVEDVFAGCGPLGGIHAGLVASNTDLNVVIAVDMPAVTGKLLEFLLMRARESGKLVTVLKIDGFWQPLCAVYRKAFADIAEQALRAGNCKVDALFNEENSSVVSEKELRAAGLGPELFANCNTPEDWREYTQRGSRG